VAEGVRAPKVVQIDLSELYRLGGPEVPAADILVDIVRKYVGVEILAVLNFSPDTGAEVFYDCTGAERELKRVAMLPDMERTIEEGAKLTGAELVVWLHDGYESAVAFVKREEKEEEDTSWVDEIFGK